MANVIITRASLSTIELWKLLHKLTTYIHIIPCLGYTHHAQLITHIIDCIYMYKMYLSVSNNQLQLAQLETNLHSLFKLICDRAGINLAIYVYI